MKRVSKFETTDGLLWDSELDAKNHQDVVDIATKIQEGVPTIDVNSRAKLVFYLINNIDSLMGIVRSRRQRQARASKVTMVKS